MRRRGRGGAPIALLGVALACSSGGGGSGGDSATAEITPANAEAISSEVLLGLELSAELSTLPAGLVLAEVGPALASSPAAGTTPPRIVGGTVGAAATTPIGPTTEDCTASGTVTFSGQRAEVDAPSVNDRLNLDYAQCDEGNGDPVLDGSLDSVVVAIAGDLASDLFALRLDVTFGNFVQTSAAEEIESNGAATASYDARTPPQKKSFLAGPSMTLRKNSDTIELQNFDNSLIQQNAEQAVGGHGLLTSLDMPPVFVGSVSYDTVKPITPGHEDDTVDDELAAGEFIMGGDLLITGVSNATIRLVELTDPNVELIVTDAGGQQTTLDTTWSALLD